MTQREKAHWEEEAIASAESGQCYGNDGIGRRALRLYVRSRSEGLAEQLQPLHQAYTGFQIPR